MNSYYNIFVGTENGLLKGINSYSKSFNNLNSLENLTKENEILSMCWSDDEQTKVIFGTRNQHIVEYSCNYELTAPFTDHGFFNFGTDILKSIQFVSENKYLTCTENGLVKLWDLSDKKQISEFSVGSHISCLNKNRFTSYDNSKFLFATGGKENDLKIWNLKDNQCIFRAKNLSDNWVHLREPVWITCADFLDEKKVATGTGYHQVRIYDIKSGVRRPVLNMSWSKYPITSLSVLADNTNRLIVGNTFGEMEMIDIRMADKNGECKTLRKYKGFQGTIKSMQIEKYENTGKNNKNAKSGLCVATCGLDRYLRVHDVETAQLISKVYLKSRLNCLLFSKYDPIKPAALNKNKAELEDDQLSNINSEDLGTDDLWSDMETVVCDHPEVMKKKKRIIEDRIEEFSSEPDEDNKDFQFKKPK